MPLQFTKMHGLGNDFMVIDGVRQTVNLPPHRIQQLSDRHTGIGFDQCLIIERSDTTGIDFYYRIYNATGESVGQCGNGARCIARFIQHHGLSSATQITVATITTQLTLQINLDDTVTVNMGVPQLEPETRRIPIHNHQQDIYAISIGNPHALIIVDDLNSAPVATLGKTISEHPYFPSQTNVSFLYRASDNHICLRVYERGCGETLACGSAAAASAALGQLNLGLKSPTRVSLPGGDLWVDWPNQQGPIFLTGPATFVYDGLLY